MQEDVKSLFIAVAGNEPGRDGVLNDALASYLASTLSGPDAEAKLAAVW